MTSISKGDDAVMCSSESQLDDCYQKDVSDDQRKPSSFSLNINERESKEPDLESIEEELSISLSDDGNNGTRTVSIVILDRQAIHTKPECLPYEKGHYEGVRPCVDRSCL